MSYSIFVAPVGWRDLLLPQSYYYAFIRIHSCAACIPVLGNMRDTTGNAWHHKLQLKRMADVDPFFVHIWRKPQVEI